MRGMETSRTRTSVIFMPDSPCLLRKVADVDADQCNSNCFTPIVGELDSTHCALIGPFSLIIHYEPRLFYHELHTIKNPTVQITDLSVMRNPLSPMTKRERSHLVKSLWGCVSDG